ncbi:PANX3 protein, partial [Crotophaga sulcirostris]|nr:PANX3 protein [Crotophaga sulcirostris]
MSLSHTAAEYMLSDALLPDPSGSRAKGLRLELPSDRLLKFVTVGLPLFLVSLAFAREFSAGEWWLLAQGPLGHETTGSSSAAAAKPSCLHHNSRALRWRSQETLRAALRRPHNLRLNLALANVLLLPLGSWLDSSFWPASNFPTEYPQPCSKGLCLGSDGKTVTQFGGVALTSRCVSFAPRARQERYFEFPLLERYLTCKQHAHSLVFIYILRNLLLLLFLAATCLYLVVLHLNIFFQDEFSCSIKTGLLEAEPHIPQLIPCKLVFFSIFQLISLSVGGIYVLLIPVVIYNALQLCQWDKGLLSVYEMLPAFDLLSRKMLTCPINDLNVILLFLRANISELTSFSRLNAVSALRDTTANKQDIDTVIDFMTLLAGLEATKPKHH